MLWFPQNLKVADTLRQDVTIEGVKNFDNLQQVQISNDSRLM